MECSFHNQKGIKMEIKKCCRESQINIGLLEFKPTEENFANLGRLVFEVLNRPESKRKYSIVIKDRKCILHCQEVVIHGT